jgi:hypothetical protein
MALALVGSILLLISTYLPHVVVRHTERRDRSFSLWDLLKLDDVAATSVSVRVAIAIVGNVAYFGLRGRRWMRNPLAPRAWAFAMVVVNLLVLLHVVRLSSGFESDIVNVSRGSGYYLVIAAGIAMIAGSGVGVVAPQRASATSDKTSGSKPITDAGSSHTTRTGPSASVQSEKRDRPPVPPPYSPDVAARLRQLKSLLDDELITQDEFDTRRTKILDDL